MVEQFCKSILQLDVQRKKALANLVMGLASQTNTRSVVEISLGLCYHYQFSSISKATGALFPDGKKRKQGQHGVAPDRWETEKKFVPESETFPEAIRKVLVVEHGCQPPVPPAFADAASKEVRA